MNEEADWNDKAREELRESLARFVRGELRLARRNRDDILQSCYEIHILDDCPECEQDAFRKEAAAAYDRFAAELAIERAGWPSETDCDRLDRVEAALRERGILLWQVSPCCDTCTCGELPDRFEVIDHRFPGFRDRLRGYAFFIDQNMPHDLCDDSHVSLYLGYGWISQDDSEIADDVYQENALGIAREVCQCLRDEGFEADWNGDIQRKIGLSVNWQRRTLLE